MGKIEINISGRKYVMSGEESEEHLRQVAEMVRKKMEALKKERPTLTIHTAALLAAFDFASAAIKGKKRGLEYQSAVVGKAHELLQQVEHELNSTQ